MPLGSIPHILVWPRTTAQEYVGFTPIAQELTKIGPFKDTNNFAEKDLATTHGKPTIPGLMGEQATH